jgi:PKD repeat protein
MKKNRLLLFCLLLLAGFASAQSVQRNMVVLEIGTGTWCQYCPGASNGADQLIAEGKNVAVIENHNGDVYANTFSNTRNSYYAISGYPTAVFDGTPDLGGGAACPNGNVYPTYLNNYNQSYAIPSPITLCFSGSNTGDTYTINFSVTKLNNYTGNDLRLHLVLTESNIPVTWPAAGMCMTEVNFVNRLMVPDVNGTNVSFASNTTQLYTLTFQKDPSWNATHCELVAFVQDNVTKEIFNGIKSSLNSLPATTFTLNDFAANVTSGCAPLSVDFSTSQASNVTYSWSFESGNPPTSTISNPTVSYTSSGSFDVTLTGTNGVCYDSKVKPNYISVLAAPAAPSAPTGPSSLCENPASQAYNTTPVPNTDAYTWELTPPEAGVVTPNSTSCNINWSDTWLGTAQLKVKGSNTCGIGNWSNPLNITIDAIPGQCPMPTGATTLCANAPVTQYTTIGITPSTYYLWELTPPSAGTFFQGSSVVDIDWADGFTGPASLRVKANNANCEGTFSDPLLITLNNSPASFTVTGGGTYCGPSGNGMPVELSGSETNTSYTLLKDGIATTTVVVGTGNAISFGNQLAAGDYTVQASNQASCISGMSGNAGIAVDPQAPEKPADPAGPVIIITSTTPTSEFVTQSTYASSYSWNLTPAEAGIISGTAATGLITWNQSYIGTSIIKVQGVNTCGSSSYSNEVTTSVNIGVGLPDNQKADVRLSPNPATNIVTIKVSKEMVCDLTILNNNGKVVISKPGMNLDKETRLDVSMLSTGLYNVVLRNQAGIRSLKLVIEK